MGEEQSEAFDVQPLIETRLAWDLLPHDEMQEWLPRLGLTPGHPDVQELEHREAHERASEVVPIAELAEVYTALITKIQAAYLGHVAKCDKAELEAFSEEVFQLSRAAVLAILVEFLDKDILTYGPAVLLMPDKDGE